MALAERAMVFLMMMAAVQVSYAAVYNVGGSAGWTTIGFIDYQRWAAYYNFQVGDTLIFEYESQYHNVLRVTQAKYESCDASSPLATFTSGNDSIVLTNQGHHFFICGFPGHCERRMKVDINVTGVSSAALNRAAPSMHLHQK